MGRQIVRVLILCECFAGSLQRTRFAACSRPSL